MTTRLLRIKIDHLVVNGGGNADPEEVRRAIQAELARLAASATRLIPPATGAAIAATGSGAIDHLTVRAGDPLDQPGSIGTHVGRSIWNCVQARSSNESDGTRETS